MLIEPPGKTAPARRHAPSPAMRGHAQGNNRRHAPETACGVFR
jgi:hypothetical protein